MSLKGSKALPVIILQPNKMFWQTAWFYLSHFKFIKTELLNFKLFTD